MGRINRWEDVVLCILVDYPATRSDDRLLYFWVLKKEGFSTKISLESFLLASYGYPNYDSITRIRRKLQEKYPELAAEAGVEIMRSKAEEEYREYATT